MDGYTGFNGLFGNDKASEQACMVHVRRKFVEIYEREGSAIAEETIKRIAALYAVEKEARYKPAEERAALRQEKAKPVFEGLEAWLQLQLPKISGKSTLAEAIRYALGRMPKAKAYLENGQLESDNNICERSIRPVTKRVSLCTPSSSVCKHWKCIRVNAATRATFSGYGSFDRLRCQVVGTDLIRRTGYNLYSRKDAGFDKASDNVVCDA